MINLNNDVFVCPADRLLLPVHRVWQHRLTMEGLHPSQPRLLLRPSTSNQRHRLLSVLPVLCVCVCERSLSICVHMSISPYFSSLCHSFLLSGWEVFRDEHPGVHAVCRRLLFAGQRPPFWPMGRHPCRVHKPGQLLRPRPKWRGPSGL